MFPDNSAFKRQEELLDLFRNEEEPTLPESLPSRSSSSVDARELEDWYYEVDRLSKQSRPDPDRDDLENLRDRIYRHLR